MKTPSVQTRAVLVVLALLALSAGAGWYGSPRPAAAQGPSAQGLLPGEEDGSFMDNEDPEDAPGAERATALPPPGIPVPCPIDPLAVAVPPGGVVPCKPCLPFPTAQAGPERPAVVVPPPAPNPCVTPSIRAVQGAVNLANHVQAESLRTLDPGVLRRAFVQPAYGQMAAYVDELWWRGHYAQARLLGVRHLDTTVVGRSARTRTLERWEYREYDSYSGRLVYSQSQHVENIWQLVKIGSRWYVSNVEILFR